jgi:triosephosphate isomerase
MKKLVVANWKMYGQPAMARQLAAAVVQQAAQTSAASVVMCPPAILVADIAKSLDNQMVAVGGQDCHADAEGAHTGDISAVMLKDAGCSHVIVGHSERRTNHGETSAQVNAKAARAIVSGLIPIICIGETLAEREKGEAEAVVGAQLRQSIPDSAAQGNFVLAYEPVWAIGSGKTPTTDDIRQMHRYIVSVASERTGVAPAAVAVLYGGSVKAANAKDIMATEAVAGVLVGGASLKADEFCSIIAAA